MKYLPALIGASFRRFVLMAVVSGLCALVGRAAVVTNTSDRDSGTPQPRGWLGDRESEAMQLPVLTPAGRGELFFIDADIADPGAFWLAAPAGATVVCVPAGVDAWDFMAAEAGNYRNLRAIHLVSHGEPGALTLNRRRYTAADLADRAAALQQLGHALSRNGDLLVYGCDSGAGAEGARLVATLSEFTGADVAASSNLTGGLAGADWNLEIMSGVIETSAIAPAGYAHALVTATVTTVAQLKSAIATGNSDGFADTITLGNDITFTSAADAITISVTDGQTMSIVGGGFTLSGNDQARVLNVTAGAVAIINLTITKGYVMGADGGIGVAGGDSLGAGIRNLGTLTLKNCTISGNRAAGGGGGGGGSGSAKSGGAGGTASNGTISISGRSGISGSNSGIGGDGGGAVAGIFNSGSMYVSGSSTITGNVAAGGGGGGGAIAGFGGRGVGGVWNTGSFSITAVCLAAMANNVGTSGDGGVDASGHALGSYLPEPNILNSGTLNSTYIPPNAAPVVANLGGDTLAFTEDSGALVLDQGTGASVTDDDFPSDLNGGNVTVSIVTNHVSGEDVLSIRHQGTGASQIGVSGGNVSYAGTTIGTFTGGSGTNNLVVTLNANSTLTNVGALLQNLTYYNSNSGNPSTSTRTVAVTINDGDGGASAAANVTVTLAAVNDAPSGSGLPTDVTVLEDTLSNFDLSAVTLSDPDAGTGSMTLTLTASAGTLSATSGGGITAGGSGTGTLTLTGTLANLNPFIDTVAAIKYTGATNATGDNAATVTVKLNDGALEVTLGTVNVDITAVNDAPIASITPITYSATEQTPLTLKGTGLAISDVDAGAATAMTVILSVSEGALNATAGDSGATVANSGTSSMTLTGTHAQINALLGSGGTSTLGYFNNSDTPLATVTLTLQVSDGALTATDTAAISSSAVNDAPTAIALSISSINESAAIAGATIGTISSTDVDSTTFAYSLVTGTGDTDNALFSISGSTLQIGGAALGHGSYAVRVRTTDSDSAAFEQALTITVADDVAPAAPSAPDLVAGSDTGASSTDNLTSDTTPTLSGVAEANCTVGFFRAGTISLGATTADSTGAWIFTPGSPMVTGTHSITAKAIDAAGNTSPASVALSITIDVTVPAAPSISVVTATTVSGTADAGSTVNIYDGSTLLGTTTTAGDGTWSLPVTLNDGAHNLTASATDGAGNVGSASVAITPTIDTVAPSAPVFTTTASLTNDTAPTLSGTAEAGSTVKIYDGATLLGITTVGSDGTWSFTPTLALSEGAHTITAKATDVAGNISSASSVVSLTIDVTAPVSPAITSVTATTVSGTAEPGSTLKVFDGSTLLGTITAGIDGTWSLPVTLVDGTHSLTATATDASGNVGTGSTVITPTIDTVAPAAPVFSVTTFLTNDTTPTLSGTAEAGSTVKVFDGTTLLGTTIAGSDGTWSFTPTLALSEGVHAITAKATDVSGNAGVTSSVVSLTIDVTAPVSTAITNVSATTVSGTAEAGSTVKLFDGSILLGMTTTASDGTWSLPVTLTDGTHSLTATATDGTGNIGTASSAITPMIDTVAPAVPVFSTTATLTNNPTPTLSGSAEPGSRVAIYDGTTLLGTTTVDSNGTWSYTPTLALSEGAHTITAKATDVAGNISSASSVVSLTIDVTTPAAPSITKVSATAVSGTAEAGSTVKIFDGSTLLGTTTAANDGTWSLPVTLVDGTHSLTATATDDSGNAGTGSIVITPTIDTVAPAAPVISNASGNTTAKTPTLAGTAETGSTVKIYDGATLLGATTATGGAWSFTLTTALTGGSHAITAKATDVAGNTSTAAALTLIVGTAPSIAASPVTQTVAAGSSANLTVSATGTATLNYQWQKSVDDTVFAAISGATTATYAIANATVASTGYYRVVVSNSFGTATSASAFLSVTPAYTAPKPDGSVATVTGGSGTGSQSVTVLTVADFTTYATSSTPYVMTVVGTLAIGTVNVTSNKTIQGADGSATLLGNLTLGTGVSNVVIRGLNLTNPGTTIVNGAYTDGGDALTLSGSSNVFVTHVTFFDCADHAIKIINGSDNVTVSWCEFYNTSTTLLHRISVQIGNGAENKPLHVTLHHNWWTTNVDQQMPLSTYGYVHQYNNYFASAGNSSGTVVSDQSQLLSERNVYTGMVNPLTKQTVSATLTAGRIRVIGNAYTTCTGTAPDAGTDLVFTPAYSYEMLPTSDVATEVSTLAGNTAGAGSSDAATGTATSAGPSAAVTPGSSFTLTSTASGFTATAYQWRLNNVDIAGATASTYACSNAQTVNAGTYTVAISMASGDTVVSTPLVVALGSRPPTNNGSSGSSGGGSFAVWFYAALALLTSLRVMRRRIR